MSSSRSSARRVIHATLEIQVERNAIADKLREGRLFIRERFHQSLRSWYLFRLLRSSTLCVDVDVRGKFKAFVSHRSARTLSPLTFSHIVSPQFTSPCIPPILSHLQSAGNFIYSCQSRPACRNAILVAEFHARSTRLKLHAKYPLIKCLSRSILFSMKTYPSFRGIRFNVNVRVRISRDGTTRGLIDHGAVRWWKVFTIP